MKFDYFPKKYFDRRNLKIVPDCLIFETVSENIFFETVVKV